jgi:hypothetical protein
MKKLLFVLISFFALASCKSGKQLTIPADEKFIATKITSEQAAEYERAYQSDPGFKAAFRNGMYLPVSIIDEIRKTTGIEGIALNYGKHPDYASPVFILFATSTKPDNSAKKSDGTENAIYMVYYPCPTICGKNR